MKTMLWMTTLGLCAMSAAFGAWLGNDSVPEVAHAQSQAPIQIALLNLEKASRQSKTFKARKVEWEKTQAELKEESDKRRKELERNKAQLRTYQNNGERGKALDVQVVIKALEETIKAADEQQRDYLGRLLQKYQKEVLDEVMKVAKDYVRKKGYSLVLQDYSVDDKDSGLFDDAAFAQNLLNKPVLIAPGMAQNKNPYVTDITDSIIKLLK